MKNIVIFASGSGSNAQNIIEYFNKNGGGEVAAVFCNNPTAHVIQRCINLGIPCIVFNRDDFYNTRKVIELIEAFDAQLIVLAGFLWLVPPSLLETYAQRVINIHPALLPKFGGKGMYGMRVHEAVVAAKEIQSGITVHAIDAEYDKGKIIFNATTEVEPTDTAETLAHKIHMLEQKYVPQAVHSYLATLP